MAEPLAPCLEFRQRPPLRALGEALGCVYQALSYRAIEGACEPADRWLWAGQDDTWLRRARELAAEL